MTVNEVFSRIEDIEVICLHLNYHICGRVYDIFGTQEFKENRIGDMLVMQIASNENELYIKAVSV